MGRQQPGVLVGSDAGVFVGRCVAYHCGEIVHLHRAERDSVDARSGEGARVLLEAIRL